MDYKYIEQLMQRYWNGESSVEEESVLRAFFSQSDLPASLRPYRELFAYVDDEKKSDTLGDDFDSRLLSVTCERRTVSGRIARMTTGLRPLFRAAAIVAFIIVLGGAVQVLFENNEAPVVVSMQDDTSYSDGVSTAYTDTIAADTVPMVSRL